MAADSGEQADWAARLAGDYTGWLRPVDGVWEDLIGVVRLACTPSAEGELEVTITTIELGAWTGRFRVAEAKVEGSTGQGDVRFALEPEQPEEGTLRLRGTIASDAEGTLYEMLLTHD